MHTAEIAFIIIYINYVITMLKYHVSQNKSIKLNTHTCSRKNIYKNNDVNI